MLTLSRATVFLVAFLLAHPAYADVFYRCDTQRNYISIAAEDSTSLVPVSGDMETISSSGITQIEGEGQGAFRKGTKPMVKHCHLSSGSYIITFDAHWINANLDSIDGGDDWVTVKITSKKGSVLSRTVIGRCSNSRPGTLNCKNTWAIGVWLDGQAGSLTLTRLFDEWSP